MKDLKLTPEGAAFAVGFNNKTAPLGERDDVHLFLIEAYKARRKDYIAFFTDPPSLDELLKAEADKKLEGNAVYGTNPLHLPAGATVKTASPAPPVAQPAAAPVHHKTPVPAHPGKPAQTTA